MINCIAIDDEPKALDVIERYCQKIDAICLKTTFREPVKAVEFLNQEKIDLVFLDINMPDINGIQLIATLAVKPMVVFTTAYSNHAVESYNLNAIDYLLKPITFERFLAAVNKAQNIFLIKNNETAKSEMAGTVFIKSGPQTYQVKISDIFYLEKDGNYITVYLKDKKILIRENMTDIFSIVPSDQFVRVHKSFVVAVKHITMIEVHQVIINGEKIPIGSTYRESLRVKLGLE
ncbi:MAG: ypdB 1 [Mucilaginibacter sp.]|nr:ypdB 1 [Mucilaginibacter sp.]